MGQGCKYLIYDSLLLIDVVDSESVNTALRCLMPMMPKKRITQTKKVAING